MLFSKSCHCSSSNLFQAISNEKLYIFLPCLAKILFIAQSVFLLKGEYKSKNSHKESNFMSGKISFLRNSTRQDFTFGGGLKHFAHTVLR